MMRVMKIAWFADVQMTERRGCSDKLGTLTELGLA